MPHIHPQQLITPASGWLLITTALLNIIWPMQHSIAARNILLGITLTSAFYLWRRSTQSPLVTNTLRTSAKWYILLSTWLLITVLLADEKLNSLDQYRGEWGIATLALLAGTLTARLSYRPNSKKDTQPIITALALAMVLPSLLVLGNAAWVIIQTHSLPLWDAPLLGRTSASQVTNMLYGFLIADALSRSGSNNRLLPVSHSALSALILLTLITTYLLNTRNGTISILVLTTIAALIFLYQQRRTIKTSWLILGGTILTLAFTGFAKISYQADPRWTKFNESIRIAFDTEQNRAWLDKRIPLPLMSNGESVDHSAYMRLAWAKEGILAIRDYPLGVGFGRNAFGHAMKRKYGSGTGHSHSSLIDFTLSGGIPGILIWLYLSALLMRLGWCTYRRHGSAIGLALTLLVSGTLFRMIIDSNLRDHGLEQYFFLVAALATLTANEKQT